MNLIPFFFVIIKILLPPRPTLLQAHYAMGCEPGGGQQHLDYRNPLATALAPARCSLAGVKRSLVLLGTGLEATAIRSGNKGTHLSCQKL